MGKNYNFSKKISYFVSCTEFLAKIMLNWIMHFQKTWSDIFLHINLELDDVIRKHYTKDLQLSHIYVELEFNFVCTVHCAT